MPYLLDTNFAFDLARNPQDRVTRHILEVGEAKVRTSIMVADNEREFARIGDLPRETWLRES